MGELYPERRMVTTAALPKEARRPNAPGGPQLPGPSEDQLRSQLDDATVASGRDHTEVRRGQVLRHVQELRMVEGVEGLHAELQRRVLRELEVLEEAEVQAVLAGPSQDAAAGVAEFARAPAGRRPPC